MVLRHFLILKLFHNEIIISSKNIKTAHKMHTNNIKKIRLYLPILQMLLHRNSEHVYNV